MRNILIWFAISTAYQAIAQTGPAGVGSSASNVLWLSADKTVYNNAGTTLAANGDNVQQWNDRSGNGKNASEGTVGNRPNYVTNVVNGFPVIRYTAANTDRLLSTGLSTGNQASVWVVAKYTSLPSSNPGLLQGAASGNGFSSNAADKNVGMWVSNTTNQVWGRGIQTNTTQVQIPQTTALSSGTFYTLNSNYDGSNIIQYVNNSTAGTVAYDGTLASWTDMAIGVQAGTENWNGDIAEVIAYNNSVNSAQRLIIANYLSAKYGLTLGTNDIYVQDNAGNGNYDFEVAGIGRVNATNIQSDSRGSDIVEISNPTNLNDNEFLIWGHNSGTLGTFGVGDRPAGVQGRWSRSWRVNEVNASGTSVDVGGIDITFDLTGFGAVTASHLRLLVDADNNGLFANDATISGATSIGSNKYKFSGVTAINNNMRFTLGTTNVSSTELPIELVSFTAADVDRTTVKLMWSTASEHNNDYFSIERSNDAETWNTVMVMDAVGNASQLTDYSAVDHGACGAICYYRLRQTDVDGTSTTSDIVAVDLDRPAGTAPMVYPNPSEGPVHVVFPNPPSDVVDFSLFDETGRSVAIRKEQVGEGVFVLDPGSPVPGLYALRMLIGDVPTVCSVHIQR